MDRLGAIPSTLWVQVPIPAPSAATCPGTSSTWAPPEPTPSLPPRHQLKLGAVLDTTQSAVPYTVYTRDDAAAQGGPDPARTVRGEDDLRVLAAGAFLQDQIKVGRLTLFPGVRFDVQNSSLLSSGASSLLLGPSVRLGIAYALTPDWMAHAFAGYLWQPPNFDAPTAGRALGLLSPDKPPPFDLQAERDGYAELGLAGRVLPQLVLALTPWVRISRYTIDDSDVSNTDLRAEYNYEKGRAVGVELEGKLALGNRFDSFANATWAVVEAQGIATARYLFSHDQLAYAGWQPLDHAQTWTANAGFDLHDAAADTHLSGALGYGSGMPTGPNNLGTLPPHATIDLGLRHRFEVPLKPEVSIDVFNVFNEIYPYRIANASFSGSAYAPLRRVLLRLIVPLG
jgi:outer membrane receptor protein involved in Fe transport